MQGGECSSELLKVLSFTLAEWDSSRTILQPTHNHQHLLLSGNESSPGLIYMYHIASQLLIRTFPGKHIHFSRLLLSEGLVSTKNCFIF